MSNKPVESWGGWSELQEHKGSDTGYDKTRELLSPAIRAYLRQEGVRHTPGCDSSGNGLA